MTCPRCKTPMKELKRTFHKQRKWICPKCEFVRFQRTPAKKSDKSKLRPE